MLAAALLSSWRLRFAVDPSELLDALRPLASVEEPHDALGWLSELGLGYERLRDYNGQMVNRMSFLSSLLAMLVILQTVIWIVALAAVR